MLRKEHRDTLNKQWYSPEASSQLSAAQGVLWWCLVSPHSVVSAGFLFPLDWPFTLWVHTCFWLLQSPLAGSSKDELTAHYLKTTFVHWLWMNFGQIARTPCWFLCWKRQQPLLVHLLHYINYLQISVVCPLSFCQPASSHLFSDTTNESHSIFALHQTISAFNAFFLKTGKWIFRLCSWGVSHAASWHCPGFQSSPDLPFFHCCWAWKWHFCVMCIL